MDVTSLKKYIYENNKIEYVLEQIGCNNIQYHPIKEFYSCSNYDGDNKNAINVRNNKYLSVKNWTRDFDDNVDLITLVEYNKKISFVDAIKYLHNILGLEYKWNSKKEIVKKIDPLDVFKRHQGYKRVDVNDIHVLDEELLNDFVPMLYVDWLCKDGIIEKTRKKFGICYSYKKKRVVLPIRHWMTGQLVGTNMRTTVSNYDEFNIPKYFLTPTYQKSLNIYGLYENYESIKKAGYVCVYEGERSVLKRDSLNDGTGVAIQGHSLSDEQIRILIGLNVDIVIAMDNDIDINEIRFMAEKFYRIRNVYYIKDKHDLLGGKDSPADAKNKIFQFLFKYKTKYDETEHKKYLESLKR